MEFLNTVDGEIVEVLGVSQFKGKYWVMSNVPASTISAIGEADDCILKDGIDYEYDEKNDWYWCEVLIKEPWVEYFFNQGILSVTLNNQIYMYRISTESNITEMINIVVRDGLGPQQPFTKIDYRANRHLKDYDGEWIEV